MLAEKSERLVFGRLSLKELKRIRQPRKVPYKGEPTKEYFLTEPLNLAARWQYHLWLKKAQEEDEFSTNEVLLPNQQKLVSLFFYPQPPYGHWLNEADTIVQITGEPKTSGFRKSALGALARIWRRSKIGSRATEILIPSHFLYRQLVRDELITVDKIAELSSTDIERVTGNRNVLEELVGKMQVHYPGWDSEVVFTSELPPDEAVRKSRVIEGRR